jgi:hypothetical protein
MFVVYDGFYSYMFVYPKWIYYTPFSLKYASTTSYCQAFYNRWYDDSSDGRGKFDILQFVKDGSNVDESSITIELYYR